MTTAPPDLPDDRLDPAAGRREALRAALATPPDTAAPDELVERLRSRRSAGHVAAAYSAAHGHPVDLEPAPGRSRWALAGPAGTAAAAVLLLVAVIAAAVALWPRETLEPLPVPAATAAPAAPVAPGGDGSSDRTDPAAAPPPGADDPGPAVVVHVIGQVAAPGLVTVPAGSRVADAVEAAGGAGPEADLTALNLARPVVDGEQVHVPAPGEEPLVADPPAGGSGADAGPVPLNTADAVALTALPGVGPVLADRIVAWRDEHGPFSRLDELTEVSGIGPVLLEGLRDRVVL
ncbi:MULTISPECIES: helix-hairpin-helix domain-containing protein [unclassified Isoptericola]|uniref:helix-hairpin-helix domain-containing protein n=1 Tax=unclassified Isoptericola TaxID=2623355 RepID=UPI0027139D94|nr:MULTISPECIES: helix-hairpin-helix domain-containing protein [unclassified Isoptericola]MDO8145363.1 helix-hairpin-helix domain-containing protein [Isoptericola sp. 178]MDO8149004.1 helix-hairpin-helix domain-containing protein [Isoptericola sp. b515]